jgi:hypothetical protein
MYLHFIYLFFLLSLRDYMNLLSALERVNDFPLVC